ncbi:MAG: hypothetical protein CFH22_01556, partial [Alphaproteobacteria bacterium MarineAlpha5_Bin12]
KKNKILGVNIDLNQQEFLMLLKIIWMTGQQF